MWFLQYWSMKLSLVSPAEVVEVEVAVAERCQTLMLNPGFSKPLME